MTQTTNTADSAAYPVLFHAGMSLIALLLVSLPIGKFSADTARTDPTATPCAILLHGLGRTQRSMRDMERGLSDAGFATVNQNHPSQDETIERLAMSALPEAIAQCHDVGARPINFVTHSMGGILVRYFLSPESLPDLGRVVMLAPPNQGSEVTDELKDNPAYRWYNGPAGQQLGTGPDSLPRRLGPVRYPLGVIAGNRSHWVDSRFAEMIPGQDDGIVGVSNT